MEQKINKRLISHINDGYLQRLYLQKGADTAEKKAEIYNQVVDDIRKFVRGESEDNLHFTYDYISPDGQTRSTWWLETIDCEEDDDVLTEQRAYNDYQQAQRGQAPLRPARPESCPIIYLKGNIFASDDATLLTLGH